VDFRTSGDFRGRNGEENGEGKAAVTWAATPCIGRASARWGYGGGLPRLRTEDFLEGMLLVHQWIEQRTSNSC